MKKGWILVGMFVFGMSAVSCGKKNEAGKGGAAAKESSAQVVASVEKELGEKPKIHVAVNLASVKESPLYSMLKDALEKEIGQKECAKKAVESAESMVILGSTKSLGGAVKDDSGNAKNDENIYMVLKSADAKAMLACMKESKEGIQDAKLNGADVLSFEKDGQTGYVWAASDKAIVMVAGPWAQKVTPGKGATGKGEIASMAGSKSIAFSVSDLDEVKEASGIVDLAKGLMLDVSVTLKEEAKAKDYEKKFQESKKQADQIPIPGLADIVKSIKFSRNGAVIGVQLTVSADQLKQLMSIAKGMGGGLGM